MAKELILLTDIDGLGYEADIVKVNEGYARNYLIPKKMAAPVNKAALKKIEKNRLEREARRKTEMEAAQKIAEQLASISCTINAKIGEQDKLYGSITASDIADA